MNAFHTILKSIQDRLQLQSNDYGVISLLLSEELHFPVAKTDIKLNNTILTINVPPLVHPEVFLRKNNILQACKQRNIPVTDIQVLIK